MPRQTKEARHGYYSIDETSASGNTGVAMGTEPQPMLTFSEKIKLIKAEASARTAGFSSGLSELNAYRAWLQTGGRLNANHNNATKFIRRLC